jgi:3-hydroxybutyryl-CoA dehydrogenase
MRFEHVLVVGAGQMGSGIAQVVAASGRRVSLHDAAPGAVERALERIGRGLARAEQKGGPPAAEARARVTPVDDLVPADLLIEAVVEHRTVKEELFRRADEALPPEAILASNTSSIPITSLAAVTRRPERVVGMHFFNPVPVLKLVEVIRAVQTSDETAAAIVELARDLGKTPAEARDFPGFASNRILMPFINEAARALKRGGGAPITCPWSASAATRRPPPRSSGTARAAPCRRTSSSPSASASSPSTSAFGPRSTSGTSAGRAGSYGTLTSRRSNAGTASVATTTASASRTSACHGSSPRASGSEPT